MQEAAIIGAGFTGLTAGLRLVKQGFKVTIFESETQPGGLAKGFQEKNWEWPLEEHYHHVFTSDNAILKLARELNHHILIIRPKTSTFYQGKIYQLDSPIGLIQFSPLSLVSRIRTGLVLLYLKITSFWKPLEKITAHDFLVKTMGREVWNILWKPLMIKKFDKFTAEVAASWFWARIKKRTVKLGYPEGGFEGLAKNLAERIKESGGQILYQTPVKKIEKIGNQFKVKAQNGQQFTFDYVICTLPAGIFTSITIGLPRFYLGSLNKLESIGAVNLVLSLNKKFFKDNTYWLNVNDLDIPMLAVVEHTNFMDARKYNREHLLYVGNYLSASHKYFNMSKEELISEYLPYLQKINPDFDRSDIKDSWIFKSAFAQPIIRKNYSRHIPALKTPINNLYLANMQQVYPWDRGTNYAVELGNQVAKLLIKDAYSR